MTIKLDMEKAYDKIERSFLFKTLNKFGFHDKVINWIKECVTSISFSVLVNNHDLVVRQSIFGSKGCELSIAESVQSTTVGGDP